MMGSMLENFWHWIADTHWTNWIIYQKGERERDHTKRPNKHECAQLFLLGLI